jgi:hypothetical protein
MGNKTIAHSSFLKIKGNSYESQPFLNTNHDLK